MTESSYMGLTIGPIYNTLLQVRRTRAVWAASYFFSWFIKQVVDRSKKAGLSIILPYSEKIYAGSFGAGLYADRVYFDLKGSAKSELELILNQILDELSEDISKHTGKDKKDILHYLHEYLNLHITESHISNKDEILYKLNDDLDQKELFTNAPLHNEDNFLLEYLDTPLSVFTRLAEDAFGKSRGLRFKCIAEIATGTLRGLNTLQYDIIAQATLSNKKSKSEDIDFIDAVQNNEDLSGFLKPHHKYYTVLYADGDNIGNLLKKISHDFSALQTFSRHLFDFGLRAEQVIRNFGGCAIYLGGEDILAFLPLAYSPEANAYTHNLLDLIHLLDVEFEETLGRYAKEINVNPPSLSYGLMSAYVKFPLKEAMHTAHGLLEELKNNKLKFPGKNTIGWRLQKHSGQYLQCFIDKTKTCSWSALRSITIEYTKEIDYDQTKKEPENARLLSGVIHRLQDPLFTDVFYLAVREERLEPFFNNFFNEGIHKTTGTEKFLTDLRGLSEKVFNDYPDNEDAIKILFTVLRYIHFINSNRE